MEASALAGVLKYFVGLVLAPWLWHERKRVDSLQREIDQQRSDNREKYYTKEETKEQIILRQKPIIDKLDLIHQEIKQMRENSNANR